MKLPIVICSLLLSGASLGATNCEKPVGPSIPEQDLSNHLERQLNREITEFLDQTASYLACVRAEYWAGQANGLPEAQLQGLVEENNVTVKEVDELAAMYEERIGPIKKVLPRGRVAASGRRSSTANGLSLYVDQHRFPTYIQPQDLGMNPHVQQQQ